MRREEGIQHGNPISTSTANSVQHRTVMSLRQASDGSPNIGCEVAEHVLPRPGTDQGPHGAFQGMKHEVEEVNVPVDESPGDRGTFEFPRCTAPPGTNQRQLLCMDAK